MTDKLDKLLGELRTEDQAISLSALEAQVWQRLNAERPHPRTMFVMQALRAVPVILALVLGGTVGARAMTSHDDISAFSATPAYSVLRLVK